MEFKVFVGAKASGKTHEAVKFCVENDLYLVVRDLKTADRIHSQYKDDHPYFRLPITYHALTADSMRGFRAKGVFIDNIDSYFDAFFNGKVKGGTLINPYGHPNVVQVYKKEPVISYYKPVPLMAKARKIIEFLRDELGYNFETEEGYAKAKTFFYELLLDVARESSAEVVAETMGNLQRTGRIDLYKQLRSKQLEE